MDEEECDQGNAARGRRAEDETEKEKKEMGKVNYAENNCDVDDEDVQMSVMTMQT